MNIEHAPTVGRRSGPTRRGDELGRFEEIDSAVRRLMSRLGAGEARYPVLIARDTLERAGYPEAFPHLLMAAAPAADADADPARLLEPANLARPEWCLSPAVCYHAYAELAGRTLAAAVAVTARGRCFRREDPADLAPGVRQIEFEMREIILAGPADRVAAAAEEARAAVGGLAGSLGLRGSWEPAEDPFFLPRARGKALMQRLAGTKLELRLSGRGAGAGLAVASVNRHGDFFGQRFGILDGDGRPAHTACVAVGLDRWAAHATADTDGTDREARP
jgi:seryl-tRNA synthetase